MRRLKGVIRTALLLAAAAVVLATFFSDHEDDYGVVALPQGTVSLPEGQVKVYIDEPGSASGAHRLSQPLQFEVRPLAGGAPLEKKATAKYGTGAVQIERSQDLGEIGSVAELEVPASGQYAIAGRLGQGARSAELSFGTDSFAAVAERWRLLGLLVGAAVLIPLIPLPARRYARASARSIGV